MSDTFDGPGFWMASDGKWYPPDRHPDQRYRDRFGESEPNPTEFPAVEIHQLPEDDDVADQTEATTPSTPYVELSRAESTAIPPELTDSTPAESATSQHEIDESIVSAHQAETAELSGVDLEAEMTRVRHQRAAAARESVARAADEPEAPAVDSDALESHAADTGAVESAAVESDIENFSVASAPLIEAPEERPTFEDTLAPSVVEAPQRVRVGRTELELDVPKGTETPSLNIDTPRRSGALGRPGSATLGNASVEAEIPSSRALVPFEGVLLHRASTRDRIVATIVFLAGIALIVGTFINWTIGDVVQTGWERGDGIVTVIAGVIGSSMAGPLFVGYRHLIPKVITILCGVISGAVLGLFAANSVLPSTATGIDFGAGFIITAVGAAWMTIAGILDQGEVLA